MTISFVICHTDVPVALEALIFSEAAEGACFFAMGKATEGAHFLPPYPWWTCSHHEEANEDSMY